jgi:methyl-accepting chemotaxis protein
MRLIRDGLSQPEELENVFSGVRAGRNVERVGALVVAADTVNTQIDGRRFVEVKDDKKAQLRGDLPPGLYEVPKTGECQVERGRSLTVRCTAKDQDFEAMVVAVFSLKSLLQAETENQTIGLWVLVAALAIGLLLAFFFSTALAGPMGVVTRVAREVAAGDVTVASVEVGGAEEVTSMATSVNDMLANLRNLVTQMVSLTDRLNGAAQGLITASADQEHVTSQQSAYAQQIAATFEELSRTAEMINASTDVVEQSAVRTNTAVDEGRAVLGDVVQRISEIRRESKEVAEAIS